MGQINKKSGVFSGEPRMIWRTESGPDRKMKLTESFTFTDAKGRVWDAPEGRSVDGASIPRALWALVGSPYTGNYRRASIVHDIVCDAHPQDGPERKAGDEMFHNACRAGGCGPIEATLLYLGVRIGSSWARASLMPVEDENALVKLEASESDIALQQEFARLGREVVADSQAEALYDASPEHEAAAAIASVDRILALHGVEAGARASSPAR
jgi:hypothetical protein